MRLLVIGSDKIFAIENYYVKFLRELNVEVYHFPSQTIFYEFYNRSIVNKVLFKAGYSNIYKRINNSFREVVNSFKPDIILVFKGMEISPEFLELAKEKGIKLVNYNPDNPFIFSGRGSGNKNIINSVELYDLHLTYNFDIKNKIEKEYKLPVKILPFGFHVNENVYLNLLDQPETVKACFLGNPDKTRMEFITGLANNGVAIDIFGNDWNKWISHKNLMVYPAVFGDELWTTLRKYRAQINIMRAHNLNSHNMRSFEVPGIGGIMVAPKTIDHELYFENKKEIFLYHNVFHCAQIIRELLELPAIEADNIRKNARTRSLNSEYTYKDRAKELLTELQKL